MSASRTIIGLGTFVALAADFAASAGRDSVFLDPACAVFARFDLRMNPADPASDLAAVGRASGGEIVPVDPWTWRVLELAADVWRQSGGVFDPCTPDRDGRMDALELIAPASVHVHRPVSLDLGGIAKGVAVDIAVETLRAAGATSGIVNAGGDLRVFGAAREIHLETGAGDRVVVVEDAALAVSAPRSSRAPSGHRGLYSPITGAEVAPRFVAVRAPGAGIADALTKCAQLLPPDAFSRLLARYDAELIA